MNTTFEILLNAGVGLLAGAIYVWPFAASKAYKRIVLSGAREGRAVALLQKIVALIVATVTALAAIIVVRAFSSKPLAWIDFLSFLVCAAASGWFGWRHLYRIARDG